MTGQRLRLRPARDQDAPALAALVDSAYGHYVEQIGGPPRPMRDDYAVVVREKDVTVAELDGTLAGLLVLDADDEGFLVDNVAVAPAFQGSGVGRALLERAESEARDRGHDSIHLYTHESMSENLELYARVGYAEYDRRPAGSGEVVFLRKRLD